MQSAFFFQKLSEHADSHRRGACADVDGIQQCVSSRPFQCHPQIRPNPRHSPSACSKKQKTPRSCVGEPGSWLTAEIASLFQTYSLPRLSPSDLRDAVLALVPNADVAVADALMRLAAAADADTSLGSATPTERAAVRFSPRVLFRLARRHAAIADAGGPPMPLAPAARDAIMARFLPSRLQTAVDGWLKQARRQHIYRYKTSM